MLSAPHCVTIKVSFVSLVNVRTKTIKNFMNARVRNLRISEEPYIGKNVLLRTVGSKDDDDGGDVDAVSEHFVGVVKRGDGFVIVEVEVDLGLNFGGGVCGPAGCSIVDEAGGGYGDEGAPPLECSAGREG